MKISELKKLAGIEENKNLISNISATGTEKRNIEKKYNIQPGTDEWFKLWFSKPFLTGEKPYNINEWGRIVKNVNTTKDVSTDEIKKQAIKFGNKVDKDGRPPLISKKKNSTHSLHNLGLAENKGNKMRNLKESDLIMNKQTFLDYLRDKLLAYLNKEKDFERLGELLNIVTGRKLILSNGKFVKITNEDKNRLINQIILEVSAGGTSSGGFAAVNKPLKKKKSKNKIAPNALDNDKLFRR